MARDAKIIHKAMSSVKSENTTPENDIAESVMEKTLQVSYKLSGYIG